MYLVLANPTDKEISKCTYLLCHAWVRLYHVLDMYVVLPLNLIKIAADKFKNAHLLRHAWVRLHHVLKRAHAVEHCFGLLVHLCTRSQQQAVSEVENLLWPPRPPVRT